MTTADRRQGLTQVAWAMGLAVLWSVTAGRVMAADVEIPDANLDKVLREILKRKQIDKLDPAKKITDEDLSTIYIFEAPNRDIENLAGLDKCRNLAQVKLSGNRIKDVSPLAACPNIQWLDLSRNQIGDASPLGKLVKLQYLQLEDNQIAGIEAFSSLKALSALYLSRNQVESVASLSGLPKLTSLYLERNRVADLSPLSSLKWLSSLDVKDNQVVDVTPLAALTELRWTFLERNRIVDLAPLVAAAKKDADGEKRFAPYWNLYLTGNPLNPESKAALATLKRLGVKVHFE